jgi:hypothetical protein
VLLTRRTGQMYRDVILGDSPLAFWRQGEAAGTVMVDQKGVATGVYASSPNLGQPGLLTGDPDTAVQYVGASSDAASAAINLSTHPVITLEFWLSWTTFAANDALAFEYTPNYNTNNGFLIDPNNSTGGKFSVGLSASSLVAAMDFTRPSAGVRHHYVIELDRTQTTQAAQYRVFVDGVQQTLTVHTARVIGGNFINSSLFFMSRNLATLFGTGVLDEVALYDGWLTPAQAANHFQVGSQGSGEISLSTDTCTRMAGLARTASETSASTDSASAGTTQHRSSTDTSLSSDTPTRIIFEPRQASETSLSTDSATRLDAYARSSTETSLSADSARASVPSTRSCSDTSLSTDTAHLISQARSSSDMSLSGDIASRSTTRPRAATETSLSTDAASLARRAARSVTETSLSIDSTSATVQVVRFTAETSLSTDALSRRTGGAASTTDTSLSTDDARFTQGGFGRVSFDESLSTDEATITVRHVGNPTVVAPGARVFGTRPTAGQGARVAGVRGTTGQGARVAGRRPGP